MDRKEFCILAGLGTAGLVTGAWPTQAVAQQDVSLESRISQLQQEIVQNPRDANLHFELSKLYEEDIERYYDESLSEFKVAVDRGLKGETVIWNPLGTEATQIGSVQLERGEYDEAIKSYKIAESFNPNYPFLHSTFAEIHKERKEYDEAIGYIKRAIDIAPSDPSFYESIGMIFLENKDFRLSILNLNKSMYFDSSSKNKDLLLNVAQGYHGLKEYSNAIEALDQLPRDLRNDDRTKAFREECVGLLRQK